MAEEETRQVETSTAVPKSKPEWPFLVWIGIGIVAGMLTRWFLFR